MNKIKSIEEMTKGTRLTPEEIEKAHMEMRNKHKLSEEEIANIIAEGEATQIIATGVHLTERDKEILAADLRGELKPYEVDFLLLQEILPRDELKTAWTNFVKNNNLTLGPGPWDNI